MASLAEHSPELLKEWDYSKNLGMKPEEFGKSSKRKVWWICTKDKRHEWEATIGDRVLGTGCPVCKNILIIEGVNDLGAIHPELLGEMDKESPLFVPGKLYSTGSDKRLGWRCALGHTWEATVRNRSLQGQGCPTCAGKRLLPGFNDFATRYPSLLSEISNSKNSDFDPTIVFPSSPKSIWWECSQGHEWQASINSRAISSSGCPYCRTETLNRKRRGAKAVFVPGKDDLATRYPTIAREWNLELNAPLTPGDVRSSDKNSSIWWNCDAGHTYQTSTRNRVFGSGCTVCAGKKVVPGLNDLESQNPLAARQFSLRLNPGITPKEVLNTSFKKYWWECDLGHEWETRAYVRSRGLGCPVCANYSIVAGFNDFKSKSPELAVEWDSILNGSITTEDIYFDSIKKYFWKCELGHSFKQSPQARLRGVGCPVCGNRELLKGFNDLATRYPQLVEEWDFENNQGSSLDSLFSVTNTKYKWICSEGHRWTANLANRLYGAGCPSCASFGYDPNKTSYFYFIKNEDLLSFKIGIANVGTDRLKVWQRFGWETLFYIEGTGRQILKLETMLLRWVRHELKLSQFLTQEDMRGHKGATETFAMDSVDTGEVLKAIEASKTEAFEDASRLKRRK